MIVCLHVRACVRSFVCVGVLCVGVCLWLLCFVFVMCCVVWLCVRSFVRACAMCVRLLVCVECVR